MILTYPTLVLPPSPRVKWSSPLTRGLVGYWPLSDGGGLRARDIAGTNHGTFTGGVTQTVGPHGRALLFDGAATSKVTAANTIRESLGDISLNLWMRNTITGANQGVIVQGGGTGRIWIYVSGGSLIRSNCYWGAGKDFYTTGPITDGRWHHVSAVFDRDANSSLYYDGRLVSAISIAAVSAEAWDITTAFQIAGQVTNTLNGNVGNVAIFSRALDPAEIYALYHRPLAMIDDGVELWSPVVTIKPTVLNGGFGWSARWVSSAEITPKNIPNLISYYDASAITANDNDPLSQWDDLSGNNKHLTQGTGSLQPTFKVNQLPNGMPAIRFNDDYFNIPDISGHSEYELFILVKIDIDPPLAVQQTGIWKLGPTGASNATQFPDQSGIIRDNFATTTQKTVGNPTLTMTNWRVYNSRSKASLWQASFNSGQMFTTATNTINMPSSGLTLGYENYNGGTLHLYLRGYIAFFALFYRILTAQERGSLTAYLDKRCIVASS